MEPLIKQLDSSVVKILCSSQVITSPSSVIKELVENALDANATNIDIRLESFGLDRIEVRDNGAGVSSDDAKRMAVSHYTSKLCCYDDLGRVTSYGFRGEALASIANLCDLTIATKKGEEVGISYKYDHCGTVVAQNPIAMNQGTSVIVTKLFKTVPVRRQYYTAMNKRKEEIKKVETLLKAYSIINCRVRFTLYHDRNLIWQKGRSEDIKSSLQQVFGIALLKHLEAIQYKSPDGKVQISAFLPKKISDVQSTSHSLPDMTFVFVNRRPVTLKFANQILKKGYSDSQALFGSQMKYPVACVSIQVPTETIDINIDPSKSLVYFHSKEEIIKALNSMLENMYGLPETQIANLNTQLTNSREIPNNDQFVNETSTAVNEQESRSSTPDSLSAFLDDDFGTGWEIVMDETKVAQKIGVNNDRNELSRPCNVENKDQLTSTNVCNSSGTSNHQIVSNEFGNLNTSQWSKGCMKDSKGEIIKPPQILLGKQKTCLTKAHPELEIIDCPMKKKPRLDCNRNLTMDSFLESSTQNVNQATQSSPNFDTNTASVSAKVVQTKSMRQERKFKIASQKLKSMCEKRPNKLSFFQRDGQDKPIAAGIEKSEPVKSVVVQFNFNKVKADLLLSQSSSFLSTGESNGKDKIDVIGELDNGYWIILQENHLNILSHYRLSETLLYQRLMENHDVAKQCLEQPILLTQSNLGEKAWHVLVSLTTPNMSTDAKLPVVDYRLAKNGFGIKRYEDNERNSSMTFTLVEVASNISFYGILELKECLENLASNPSITLSESRPIKVVSYLKCEAVRIARAMPNHKSKDELLRMLRNATENLPHDLNRCFHGQPFFTPIYNLANIPEIIEE